MQSKISTDLWDFALTYYAKPQVAETCVQVQDEQGVNVCLLIALRWLDARGELLSTVQFAQLIEQVQPWMRDIVEPLRQMRRQLKLPIAAFAQDDLQAQIRTSIKQAELLAEKKLLLALQDWLLAMALPSANAGVQNAEAYLSGLGVDDISRKRLLV